MDEKYSEEYDQPGGPKDPRNGPEHIDGPLLGFDLSRDFPWPENGPFLGGDKLSFLKDVELSGTWIIDAPRAIPALITIVRDDGLILLTLDVKDGKVVAEYDQENVDEAAHQLFQFLLTVEQSVRPPASPPRETEVFPGADGRLQVDTSQDLVWSALRRVRNAGTSVADNAPSAGDSEPDAEAKLAAIAALHVASVRPFGAATYVDRVYDLCSCDWQGAHRHVEEPVQMCPTRSVIEGVVPGADG